MLILYVCVYIYTKYILYIYIDISCWHTADQLQYKKTDFWTDIRLYVLVLMLQNYNSKSKALRGKCSVVRNWLGFVLVVVRHKTSSNFLNRLGVLASKGRWRSFTLDPVAEWWRLHVNLCLCYMLSALLGSKLKVMWNHASELLMQWPSPEEKGKTLRQQNCLHMERKNQQKCGVSPRFCRKSVWSEWDRKPKGHLLWSSSSPVTGLHHH